jgi:excisionase family DNA binding protein
LCGRRGLGGLGGDLACFAGGKMPERQHTPSDPSGQRVFSTGEAAALCKVSQQTIIRCFDSGRLGGFRVPGSKFRRIPREELIRFMRAHGMPTDALERETRRRVLLVGHEAWSWLGEALARDGRFEVRRADSAYEAGLLTVEFRPDVVVMGGGVEGLGVGEVCRRLRAHPELSRTRVVWLGSERAAAGADAAVERSMPVSAAVERVAQMSGVGARTERAEA